MAHLSDIHLVCVLAGGGAVGGEDGGSVAVLVVVDQGDGFIQSVSLQNHQHRPKYLLRVARHRWLGRGGKSLRLSSASSVSRHFPHQCIL